MDVFPGGNFSTEVAVSGHRDGAPSATRTSVSSVNSAKLGHPRARQDLLMLPPLSESFFLLLTAYLPSYAASQ
jgi:hypothetical protein